MSAATAAGAGAGRGLPVPAIDRTFPLPRVELFAKPTPLHPLPRFTAAVTALAREAGHEGPAAIWVKREDLMPVGQSGNKLRNLEFHVGAALERGADTLVTPGRGRANHARLTAAAAAITGLRCVLVHNGPKPERPSPNERLSALFGAELRYAPDATLDARDRLLRETVDELRAEGRTVYEVEMGASGPIGACGQVLAGMETAAQLDQRGIMPDCLFTGSACGGTYSGLRVGLWRAGIPTTVIAVPTHLSFSPNEASFREHLVHLMGELRHTWGEGAAGSTATWSDEVRFDDLGRWVGFGEEVPEADEAAALLGRTEAIGADPAYTARSVASIVAWARAGRLDGKTALLWLGGGTPALLET